MNLFLSTLSPSSAPFGVFFSDDLSEISEVQFERNDFFVDRLSRFPELKKVQKIFYVSGPASFTSLRNMSVFLNVFTEFSDTKITLYSLSTAEFFEITFPYADVHILSVGRRESFVFQPPEISPENLENLKNSKDLYKKYKNKEGIEILQKHYSRNPELCIAGEFSENFLEMKEQEVPNIAFALPIPQVEFLEYILKNAEKFLKKNNRAVIDYGALPNIG